MQPYIEGLLQTRK